jgi:hypothetical protein
MTLARFPAGEIKMFSSYDRSGGNDDFNHFLGALDDGSYVLADVKGPGVVRRFWFTGLPADQTMRFYFDGETQPRFAVSTRSRLENRKFPLVAPLCASPSAATYCYLPLPFARRLVIASGPSKGDKYFLHLNYEQFDSQQAVRTFSLPLTTAESNAVEQVGRNWMNLSESMDAPMGGQPTAVSIPAGKSVTCWQGDGPAVINELRIRVEYPRGIPLVVRNALLRLLVLRCYWDGSDQPSVEVPLGDFFCNGLRSRKFASLLLASTGEEFVSRFPFPFRRQGRIELHNDAGAAIRAEVRVATRRLAAWDPELMYFHAGWRGGIGRNMPHTILSAGGRGQYVGCYLIAMAGEPSWNILEGDEMIYIDGEAQASMHGTGLEDYFNGGWYYGREGIFSSPLTGALEKRGIQTTQYRFHMPDPVGFTKSIRVGIEFGDGNRSRGYMSSVAYWYQPEPRPVPGRLPAMAQRLVPRDPLEKVSMMCEVFERERKGLLDEAKDLCLEYAEKYPNTPQAELMELRAIAYREEASGYDSVRDEYARVQKTAKHEEARRQAKLLQWYHESSSNALLCAHINGKYVLYLDGKEMLRGDDVTRLHVAPVKLDPGPHVLAVEVEWVRPDNWCTVHLRTHSGDLWTDRTWLNSAAAPEGWRQVSFEDSQWKPVNPNRGVLPKMAWFYFEPNGFILTQHHPQIGASVRGKKAFFRKRFETK